MKHLPHQLLLGCSALFLSACTVGPEYTPPPTPPVSSYTAEGKEIYTSEVPKEWWTTFHAPAVNSTVQKGIKNNYTLAAMQETLRQAENNVSAAKGQSLPQVSLNASPGYEKYGVEATGNTNNIPAFHYYALGPSVNWDLDIFGKHTRTVEQQNALQQYQQQQLSAAFLTLTGNIVTTSLNIAELNAKIDNIKRIIETDQEKLALVKKGGTLGSALKSEALNAASQLRADEALLAPLEIELDGAKGELNILVAAFPSEWQAPRFELEKFTSPDHPAPTLPSQLVHDRPDILAAEALLHASSAAIGIATANLYPQITLSANLTQEALSPGQLFNSASTTAGVVTGITAPIFSGGSLRAQKSAAEHAYKAAFAHYKEIVIRAFVQVSKALHALEYDEQNIVIQKLALANANASLKLAALGQSLGGSSKLEIIENQRHYAEVKLAYIEAIAQYYRDIAQFYLALGGGVTNKKPQ